MKPVLIAALAALAPAVAAAQPAAPREMADSWQLESHGRTLCVLRLSNHAGQDGVYGAQVPADCANALPPGVVGWKSTPEGLALVAADGSALVPMRRWSESLYVAYGPDAPDEQLARAVRNGGQ